MFKLINQHKNISWPEYIEELVHEKEIQIVVQLNGKKRGLIKIERNQDENFILDLIINDARFKKYIEQKEIKKKIFIKDKLINLIF